MIVGGVQYSLQARVARAMTFPKASTQWPSLGCGSDVDAPVDMEDHGIFHHRSGTYAKALVPYGVLVPPGSPELMASPTEVTRREEAPWWGGNGSQRQRREKIGLEFWVWLVRWGVFLIGGCGELF